jgi:hypothetical protein
VSGLGSSDVGVVRPVDSAALQRSLPRVICRDVREVACVHPHTLQRQVDPVFEGVTGGPGSLIKYNPLSNLTSAEVWNFLRVMVSVRDRCRKRGRATGRVTQRMFVGGGLLTVCRGGQQYPHQLMFTPPQRHSAALGLTSAAIAELPRHGHGLRWP